MIGIRLRHSDAARMACVLLACLMLMPGCAQTPDPETLRNNFLEAELLCLEQKWFEAQVLLKSILLLQPDHAGAHFYLARTHMFSPDFRPIIAEGEFQTALQLFVEQGRKTPIERFDPRYFEMMCNIEAAKANLMQINVYLNLGYPIQQMEELVVDMEHYQREARRIFPNSDDVKWLDSVVAELRAGAKNQIPAPGIQPPRTGAGPLDA